MKEDGCLFVCCHRDVACAYHRRWSSLGPAASLWDARINVWVFLIEFRIKSQTPGKIRKSKCLIHNSLSQSFRHHWWERDSSCKPAGLQSRSGRRCSSEFEKNVEILKLHFKKSASRVLDTDSDPKHSSKTVAKLFETTMSKYPSGCQKELDLNPKEKLKTCVGTARPARHQLHQEGWVTVYEKPFVKMGSLQERVTLNSMC